MSTIELPTMSLRSLALILDVDRDVVRTAIDRANLSPVGSRGGHPTYDMRQALRAVFSRRGDTPPELLPPADRKNLALAQRAEFDLQVKRGAYLEREAVRNACAEGFATVAQSVRSIPDLCERKTGAAPETLDLIESVIDQVCSDLAERMEAIHRENSDELTVA